MIVKIDTVQKCGVIGYTDDNPTFGENCTIICNDGTDESGVVTDIYDLVGGPL